MKKCYKCKETKPVDEFHRNKARHDGLDNRCKECQSKKNRENKARNQETRRKRYENNRESILESNRQYRLKNKDAVDAYYQQWRVDNPDYDKHYYRDNAEKMRAKSQRWAEQNPDLVREYAHRRRARIHGATITPLPRYWEAMVKEYYGNQCMFHGCVKEITKRNKLTIDHVIPISRGGAHAFWNMQVLCGHHNSSKNAFSNADYRDGNIMQYDFKEVI